MTTIQTVKLEGSKLHAAATATSTAQEVTLYYSNRERMRSRFTDIDATEKKLIRMGKRIVHTEYTQYWTSLEALGVGSVIHGRNGNPTRFEWSYNLRDVAKAAVEGRDLESGVVPLVVHQGPKVLKTEQRVIKNRRKTISGRRKPGRPATIVSVDFNATDLALLQRILSKAKK